MTRAVTDRLAFASSMVQLRRAPKTAREWAEPFRVGLLLKGNFGLGFKNARTLGVPLFAAQIILITGSTMGITWAGAPGQKIESFFNQTRP